MAQAFVENVLKNKQQTEPRVKMTCPQQRSRIADENQNLHLSRQAAKRTPNSRKPSKTAERIVNASSLEYNSDLIPSSYSTAVTSPQSYYHTATTSPNNHLQQSIFHTLLIFSLYFDLTLSPILECHFSNSSPNSTPPSNMNILTRLHIAIIRNHTLSKLFSRLLENPQLNNSAETLYLSFLDILQLQGIVFVDP